MTTSVAMMGSTLAADLPCWALLALAQTPFEVGQLLAEGEQVLQEVADGLFGAEFAAPPMAQEVGKWVS
jgi:hypothetical protein